MHSYGGNAGGNRPSHRPSGRRLCGVSAVCVCVCVHVEVCEVSEWVGRSESAATRVRGARNLALCAHARHALFCWLGIKSRTLGLQRATATRAGIEGRVNFASRFASHVWFAVARPWFWSPPPVHFNITRQWLVDPLSPPRWYSIRTYCGGISLRRSQIGPPAQNKSGSGLFGTHSGHMQSFRT